MATAGVAEPDASTDAIVAFEDLDADVIAEVLRTADLHVEGQLATASNATLRCVASLPDGRLLRCVYKPVAGERPLWDFPDGSLAAREVATALVDRALGWDLVPPTLWREDGPAGAGMCQAWIEHSDASIGIDVVPPNEVPAGWLPIIEGTDAQDRPVVLAHADDPGLRRMAVLDAVVNNADRKGGHVLVDARGRLRGIDHGVTFHVEDKLRTVLWGWAGDPLDPEHVAALESLAGNGALMDDLAALVTDDELEMMQERIAAMITERAYPLPSPDWPSIPWPVF